MEQPQRKLVQRVRHELRLRELVVDSVTPVGDHFVSITFGGAELADFVSLGFDDHVKFILDDAAGEPLRRDYTPRRYDAQSRQLTIEFALHGEGAASDWARQAAPGQCATIGGPKGSMIVPPDFDWHLLVADATGLPAIRRRLEELPAGTRAIVVVQVGASDRILPATQARLEVHWADHADALVASVRALTVPAGEGYAWGGGEAAMMRRVRDVLVAEKGLPKEAMRISAYWKQGAADFHEDLG
ncbi:siderophore-interacting protein [Massilia sp. S19_KUP03_FR1]|uniref:siderophore-interacting protein n=1 Tax=Massilia sp. S19_KUP03_FR1 TaxID=3025503 RepID=UPI002FCDB9D3